MLVFFVEIRADVGDFFENLTQFVRDPLFIVALNRIPHVHVVAVSANNSMVFAILMFSVDTGFAPAGSLPHEDRIGVANLLLASMRSRPIKLVGLRGSDIFTIHGTSNLSISF